MPCPIGATDVGRPNSSVAFSSVGTVAAERASVVRPPIFVTQPSPFVRIVRTAEASAVATRRTVRVRSEGGCGGASGDPNLARVERTREDGYTITTDPERIDFAVVHAFLTESYWSPGIARDVVERAARGSLTFSLRGPEGEQAGYARAITDRATYAYLADVFVRSRAPRRRARRLAGRDGPRPPRPPGPAPLGAGHRRRARPLHALRLRPAPAARAAHVQGVSARTTSAAGTARASACAWPAQRLTTSASPAARPAARSGAVTWWTSG